LSQGDTAIDGGNSHYDDVLRCTAVLKTKDLHYVDVGVSGGVWGLEGGYCMLIGGDNEAVQRLDPIFKTLDPGGSAALRTPGASGEPSWAEQGYLHRGSNGAAHFVNIVHNGTARWPHILKGSI
jgi:6-phosphogluconate dehydrogenase